jgi:hypothetical protein
MGGDDSQKLLPWSGLLLLSRAQTSGSLRNQHCIGNGTTFCAAASAIVAQLQTPWVIFGKHRWVTSDTRRRVERRRCRGKAGRR